MGLETIEINLEVLNKLIELASKNGIHFDCYEGSMLDNYIFYNTEIINLEGESANYIIVKERYLNDSSSDLIAIMTDSFDTVKYYKNGFESE